ncbi:hypothetical protein, partial [Pseudomonas cannabina]|uniref:hypothetical protein n=1 Tax=Pseudomonas cannabina TaxID=86840 RepID=UPI001C81818A
GFLFFWLSKNFISSLGHIPPVIQINVHMAIQRACPYGSASGFYRTGQGSTHARNNLPKRRFHGGSR